MRETSPKMVDIEWALCPFLNASFESLAVKNYKAIYRSLDKKKVFPQKKTLDQATALCF